MNKRFSKVAVAALVGFVAFSGLSLLTPAQQQQQQIRTPRQVPPPVNPDFSKMEIQTLKVQGNVYLLAGAGGNIAVQSGDEGILLVDTGYEKMADKVLAAVRKISNKPIRTIISTTLRDDHTGANGPLVKAGFRNQAGPGIGAKTNEAVLMGHADLLRLMTEMGEAKIAVDRWPPNTYPGKSKDFSSNDEAVMLIHVAGGATAGDSMVFFRKSDVVVTGDIFDETSFPYIDVNHGGTINGILEGLNQVLDIAVPKHLQEGGTMIIPGHGRIGDEHDVLEYRDMVTIIRDRVQNAIKKGMTLQQVKALKPSYTYEYEPRFGKNPDWTPEMFVEAVYKTLSAPK